MCVFSTAARASLVFPLQTGFVQIEFVLKEGLRQKGVAAAAGRHVLYECRSWKNQILAEVMTCANMNVCGSLCPPHLVDLFS